MNEQANSRRVGFGRYAFDLATTRLWADGNEIKLTPKAAAVLAALIEHAGRPVSKRELFASVWRNTIVGDDALSTCIQELRKALGDDARQPRYIETRHRLGYRFIAQLSTDSGPPHAVIAVLPFVDMSAARDQDFFCEGLAEELINALTYVDGLRVVSRSASFQFKAAGLDVQDIGRRLGITALLEGSVRKAGDLLRITVQLIDVASGFLTADDSAHPCGRCTSCQNALAQVGHVIGLSQARSLESPWLIAESSSAMQPRSRR
jgi:TolB-like protein